MSYSRASARMMYYMLLGAAAAATPGDHTCDPYTRPASSAANVMLDDLLEALPNTATNTTLCENMT